MADDAQPGLYDPGQERDSCGFGLIANLDNQPSRWYCSTCAAVSTAAHGLGRKSTTARTTAVTAAVSCGPRGSIPAVCVGAAAVVVMALLVVGRGERPGTTILR